MWLSPIDLKNFRLFAPALAGGDRRCGAICQQNCMMEIWEEQEKERIPAPQLETDIPELTWSARTLSLTPPGSGKRRPHPDDLIPHQGPLVASTVSYRSSSASM